MCDTYVSLDKEERRNKNAFCCSRLVGFSPLFRSTARCARPSVVVGAIAAFPFAGSNAMRCDAIIHCWALNATLRIRLSGYISPLLRPKQVRESYLAFHGMNGIACLVSPCFTCPLGPFPAFVEALPRLQGKTDVFLDNRGKPLTGRDGFECCS
ncbi:uncharacterized protein F4812DRAFT_413543 [Daldinia caldariorum]|uniref:uncharacterized protein n=1 Tax=Daldinia caldariorum TaxID=326644 RepID=UPI00200734B5|nr:uncharacterized protein F4812DRAFT_413543 [Daldinia caldariorum]KAI1471319.1 hypothetical protein F4812DRAFT_413543 [Daldinia caldariorum]